MASPSCETWLVFAEMRYEPDGSLADATGHRWVRRRDWLDPAEASALVEQGVTFLVQPCRSRPRREHPERFKRDLSPWLMTRSAAEAAFARSAEPTGSVAEFWTGIGEAPDILLFVDAPPQPRQHSELTDDWE